MCHPILVAFVWELSKEIIDLPPGLPPGWRKGLALHLAGDELPLLAEVEVVGPRQLPRPPRRHSVQHASCRDVSGGILTCWFLVIASAGPCGTKG